MRSSKMQRNEIKKEINFIWFGSAISDSLWRNMVRAKNKNTNYQINLYVDTSVISESENDEFEKMVYR